MFAVDCRPLIISLSIQKNKAAKQLKYCRILVYIHIFPAFHHLLYSHCSADNICNQGRAKYCICRRQQFCNSRQYFGWLSRWGLQCRRFFSASRSKSKFSWLLSPTKSIYINYISIVRKVNDVQENAVHYALGLAYLQDLRAIFCFSCENDGFGGL